MKIRLSKNLVSFFFFGFLLSGCNTIATQKNTNKTIDYASFQQIELKNLKIKYQPNLDAYYPRKSLEEKEMGSSIVVLYVNTDGKVLEARLLKSSNYPRLDRAAIEIGRRYVFEPLVKDNHKSEFKTNLQVNFR